MTSDERKTLEALADLSVRAEDVDDGLMGPGYHATNAAAIRSALAEIDALNRLHLSMEATAPYGTPRKGITHPDSIALLTSLEKALRDWSGDLRDSGRQYVHAKNAAYAIGCALAEIDAHDAPCAMPDCPHDGTGCARCLAAENEALLSELREARAQLAALTAERDEKHRLAVESRAKMDAAYDHADLIQHEMTTATDDCPHPTDTWTTCSACHLKVMRERDALTKQVADLEHADKCHAKFCARLCDALHIPEPHAVDGDVFDVIADLEARAIPQWWIHRAHPLEIRVTFRDGTGHSIALNGDGSVDRYDVTECGDHHGDYVHATLASALAAAAKES